MTLCSRILKSFGPLGSIALSPFSASQSWIQRMQQYYVVFETYARLMRTQHLYVVNVAKHMRCKEVTS